MKSSISVTITVKATFDSNDPSAMAKAATWIKDLQEKKLVEPPEGVEAEITTKAGRLQNHRE